MKIERTNRGRVRTALAVVTAALMTTMLAVSARAATILDLVSPVACQQMPDGDLVGCSIAGQGTITLRAPGVMSAVRMHTTFDIVTNDHCKTRFLRTLKIDVADEVDNSALFHYVQQPSFSIRRRDGKPIQTLVLTDPYNMYPGLNWIAGFDARCRMTLTIDFNVPDVQSKREAEEVLATIELGLAKKQREVERYRQMASLARSYELLRDIQDKFDAQLDNASLKKLRTVAARCLPALTQAIASPGDAVPVTAKIDLIELRSTLEAVIHTSGNGGQSIGESLGTNADDMLDSLAAALAQAQLARQYDYDYDAVADEAGKDAADLQEDLKNARILLAPWLQPAALTTSQEARP